MTCGCNSGNECCDLENSLTAELYDTESMPMEPPFPIVHSGGHWTGSETVGGSAVTIDLSFGEGCTPELQMTVGGVTCSMSLNGEWNCDPPYFDFRDAGACSGLGVVIT